MSLPRILADIPSSVSHVVGAASGLTGLALYVDLAKNLTAIVGLFAAAATLLGATFYAAYWGLKTFSRLKRVLKGDYAE